MASSATLEAPLQVANSASANSYACASSIALTFEGADSENDGKHRASKYRVSRGHALIRRQQLQRQDNIIQWPAAKNHGKRRFTFSSHQDHKLAVKRRRRFNSMALPTKFLLGGNINDPLNLRSLEDEEVNQRLNAFTPESSPIPISRHRTQVQVLIPPNIYDPLNLNTGEEIEFNLISSKSRKRKRHRKNKKEEQEIIKPIPLDLDQPEKLNSENENTTKPQPEEISEKEKTVQNISLQCEDRTIVDKIVSPVVPQGSPSKFYKRFHIKNQPKDLDDDKLVPVDKIVQKRRHSRSKCSQGTSQSTADVKFKESDNKFCYGNYPIYNFVYADDARLKCLNRQFFLGKEVLDIGCNVGHVSLYVAEHLDPKRVCGIDIDAKLISIANKNVGFHLNNSIANGVKFPMSMSFSYGPLARLSVPFIDADLTKFPNNISFNQANYVLSSDDELQDQIPEYDIILCLRITKWVHLNWGDDGLKRAFQRMYAQLRSGGQLILEPQQWQNYAKKKKLNLTTYRNYCNIKMKPEKFCEYLLSKEVGFSSCEVIGRSINQVKGYRQPIYLLTKGSCYPPSENIGLSGMMSPVAFHDAEWAHNCVDEEENDCDWSQNAIHSSIHSPTHSALSEDGDESLSYDFCSSNQMLLDADNYFFPPDCNDTEASYEP